MSKLSIWNEVQEVLDAQAKLPKGLKEALEAILAPKAGGGTINVPKEIDGVMHYYCRFHEAYEPESDMVMSSGKSKGYCKASISVWNKRNSAIKRKEAEVSELVMAGDFEQAQECSIELKTMKENLNAHVSYDLASDWASFRTEPEKA
jgi:hypothetical protein